jgi:hypothetical protein
VIARRAKPAFVPSDVGAVRRRFEHIVKRAMQKPLAESQLRPTPPKPPAFVLTSQRRSA